MVIRSTFYGPVERIEMARALPGGWRYWTTAYRVDEWLIDTGCAHAAGELLNLLESQPVLGIINTHSHEDHIGANGALQQTRDGLNIYAHPLSLPVLAEPRQRQPLRLYRKIFWGWPLPSSGAPLSDGQVLEAGRYSFLVIFTPGHSADHICLYEPDQGWLFTGDLFVGGNDRALRAGYDIWGIIKSLKCIRTLPATMLFPGSARVRQNPQAAIDQKIAYLERMGEWVLNLNEKGYSIAEISRKVFGAPMFVEFMTMGHFSRRCLVLSYLGKNEDRV